MGLHKPLPQEGASMSTSLLYHAFGVVGYRQISQAFEGGRVTIRIEQPRERLRCPHCGGAEVWAQGGEERTFRTLPIGGKPVQLRFKVPRVLCFVCFQARQVKLAFADPKKRYTRSFERYALDLSRHMPIKDVAEHLQVSWDTIKDIQAKSLQRRFIHLPANRPSAALASTVNRASAAPFDSASKIWRAGALPEYSRTWTARSRRTCSAIGTSLSRFSRRAWTLRCTSSEGLPSSACFKNGRAGRPSFPSSAPAF